MLTFQVWAMLIVGGSGNHRGAILGAVLVWGIWALSAATIDAVAPGGQQARAASLQIVVIGVLLCLILLLKPRGLIGESSAVSRHLGAAGDAGVPGMPGDASGPGGPGEIGDTGRPPGARPTAPSTSERTR